MVKLGNHLTTEVCKVILLSSATEVREMFSEKDAEVFRKVAERITEAHKKAKETKKVPPAD